MIRELPAPFTPTMSMNERIEFGRERSSSKFSLERRRDCKQSVE
jgi:hypothetical protein